MAIDLPPPLAPQPAPIEELRTQAQHELLLEYHGIRFHVFGPAIDSGTVEPARLRKDVSAARTPSDAVRTIGYLYYVSAYPAVVTSYAVAGPRDLYVRVVPGRVERVTGPPELLPYFSELPERAPLTGDLLEGGRVLADVLSERSGQKYSPSFRTSGDDGVTLDLGNPAKGDRQTAVAADFSNYGNRYGGPYLADAALRQAFSSGDELTLAGISSVRSLGLGGTHSEPYHEGSGGWSKVTRYGLFGLEARYADLHQSLSDGSANGSFAGGAASWLLPLYADLQQRYNLEARLDRNHQNMDASTAAGSGEILSEQYNSVELSLSYVGRVLSGDHQMELQAASTLRKGLGRTASPGTPADLAYFLWRPSFSIRYGFNPGWSLLAGGNFQVDGSIVPQLEQIVIGGPDSARAYEAGAGVGNHGGSVRLGTEWKDADDSWCGQHGLRPRVFAEYATASLLRTDGLGEHAGRVEVADIAAETDFRFTAWLSGTLSLAQSVYDHGASQSPDNLAKRTVFFKFAAKY